MRSSPLLCAVCMAAFGCDVSAEPSLRAGDNARDGLRGDPLASARLEAVSQAEATVSDPETLVRVKDEIIARFRHSGQPISKTPPASRILPTVVKDLPEHVRLLCDFTAALTDIEKSATTQEELVALKDELITRNRGTLRWCEEQQAAEAKASTVSVPIQNQLVGAGDIVSMDKTMLALKRIDEMQLSPEERIKQIDETLKNISNE